jgi:ATP-dependent helicase/nuclease subunit B
LARGELPDAREEGSLVHEALAAAFIATAELWPRRPRDAAAIEARGVAAADALLEGQLVGSPLRDVVLARARDSVRAVFAWSLAEDTWDFASAEQAFGEASAGSWPPYRVASGDDTVLLRGKIDRVDKGHLTAAVRAVDYKRSRRNAEQLVGKLGKTAFQVPLYALVASRATERPGTEGLYLPTGARDVPPGYAPKDAFTKKWADLLSRDPKENLTLVERVSLAVVTEVRKGTLAPLPADPTVCATCAVRGGCRQPRFAVAAEEDDGDEGA